MWFKNLLEIWAHNDKTPLRLSALYDDSEFRNVCFLHNSRYRIIMFHSCEDKTFSKVDSTLQKSKAVIIVASIIGHYLIKRFEKGFCLAEAA